LNQVWQAASAALNRAASAKGQSGAAEGHKNGAGNPQANGDVVEGELVEEESKR
jgi:hypothetical protein